MNLNSMKHMLSTSLLVQERERLGLPRLWVLSVCVRERVSVCVCVSRGGAKILCVRGVCL